MTKYLWPVTTSGLVLLMGVGLLMAPFGLHFYPHGQSWNHATYWTFWSGVGVIVFALVGIYGWVSGIGDEVRSLMPAAEAPEPAPESREREAPVPAASGDEALQQLARAVLRDLNQRLGDGGPGAGGGGA